MAITYVMHGGETSRESASNKTFYSYFTSLVPKDHVKILMCMWARYPGKREMALEKHKQKIIENTKKTIDISVAIDPKDLLAKIGEYDVLYFDGGMALNLEPYLKELSELKSKLEAKVCLGSSMGAFIISSLYVLPSDSENDLSVHNGLGLLSINCLCHWNVEGKKQEKIKLLQSASDLPIITLDECESVTIISPSPSFHRIGDN